MSAVDRATGEGRALSWSELRAITLDRADYRCQMCGEPATEADHIIPRAAGGLDAVDNLQAACRPCNRSKGAVLDVATLNWTELTRAREAARERIERRHADLALLDDLADRLRPYMAAAPERSVAEALRAMQEDAA